MLRPGLAALAAASVVTLTGCFDASTRCGEATPSGACLSVLSVVPTVNGVSTSNVDVVQGKCGDPSEPLKQTWEPFTDHDVVFTLSNDGPVNYHDPADLAPAVVINGFKAEFRLNQACNGCVGLPPLEGDGPTTTVRGGREASFSLPMMPLRSKQAFVDTGGDESQYPSYSVTYTLDGTDPTGAFKIKASTNFTVGNFNNCAQ
jgi:hypothetical protein